ncbi:DUF4245 domain-containing protein [Streptomyces sp. XD-27]|uniref:DUF4245 domain-containing protein n=1 Tax=Streptomyces sp. XD-27 TaxID=3062779 RepID=UPI0026F4678D|nr:DUF4245 domain-containing protein [Streptomyces sp. XD-27]WKX72352.1 DUF4245 domain-containing protein [Streptomyces sp. XD-27]
MRDRKPKTARGLVQSLAVVVGVAGVIYAFTAYDEDKDPIKTVDYSVELATTRRAAPYPVAAPQPGRLPDGWRATSVSYEPQSKVGAAWHLGFLDQDKQYVAVEQSDGRPATFIDEVTQEARATEKTQRIGGETWHRYAGPKYDALVHKGKGVTTVVTGTASFAQLTKMAAALQTEKG